MRFSFSILIKFFLIFFVSSFVLALSFGPVWIFDWPWWIGVFIVIGLISLYLIFLLIRSFLRNRREKQFIEQIVSDDASGFGNASKEQSDVLKERFQDAIREIKKSHLNRFGNPLYVLPWYVIIGESGSGKTTAIKNAGLSSPFAEVSRTSGFSGTQNCDWWFFEEAIIIDTAGRYAIPIDQENDQDEWHTFLRQLAKYRKKEPLNGLIVTVPADKLLSNKNDIELDAKKIRQRIAELMNILGTRFPIYIMVTKCDLIMGMTDFFKGLSDKNLDQPMGILNTDLVDALTFIKQSISQLSEHLKDLRLLALNRPGQGMPEPGVFLFPDEFIHLQSGLDLFFRHAFQENVYQESPLIRGIYFTSGCQVGQPFSTMLQSMGLINEADKVPESDKGIFLHDFFSGILPLDRKLYAPTLKTVKWKRVTKAIALGAWVTLMVFFCGLLSFSFVKNLSTLKSAAKNLSSATKLSGDFITDVAVMGEFRDIILTVEKQNENWWIPRFLLHQSLEVEEKLKQEYCKIFVDRFRFPLDREMENKFSQYSKYEPGVYTSSIISDLVKRIEFKKIRTIPDKSEAEMGQELLKAPVPTYYSLLFNDQYSDAVFSQLHHVNLYYLLWQPSIQEVSREIKMLQKWLDLILVKTGDFKWIVQWINQSSENPAYTLGDFWGVDGFDGSEPMVQAAFTVNGKKIADQFFRDLRSVTTDSPTITNKMLLFDEWYSQEYYQNWHTFVSAFPHGREKIRTREKYMNIALYIHDKASPYLSLLNVLFSEVSGFKSALSKEAVPRWVDTVGQLKLMSLQAKGEKEFQSKGSVLRLSNKGNALLNTLKNKKKRLEVGGVDNKKTSASDAYNQYLLSLKEVAEMIPSRKRCYEMAGAYFTSDMATSDLPFFKASKALRDIRMGLGLVENDANRAVWRLIQGPLDYLWYYIQQETACALQKFWEEDVLWEIQDISDEEKKYKLVASKDGVVHEFYNKRCRPFIDRNLNRLYVLNEKEGRSIPIYKSLLDFLAETRKIKISIDEADAAEERERVRRIKEREAAERAQEYEEDEDDEVHSPAPKVPSEYVLTVRGFPTDVNDNVQIKPDRTVLDVQCAKNSFHLVNRNFPVQKRLVWSAQDCGNVQFLIGVGHLELKREYEGRMGLAHFLSDFKDGEHLFYAKDFPEHYKELKRFGIEYIKVNYSLNPDEVKPILDLLRQQNKIKSKPKTKRKKKKRTQVTLPVSRKTRVMEKLSIPEEISPCWVN